ncbi:hypothetical protein DDB_G0292088 [Dictyostelium discoideum AX4]|uniref:Uncharacterized protein n=1 Tax=Dictyostelium discoideum TaxID=44689 RepID=Q54DQ1_DICDI|nr:hypothetical protein DDB_G0292088 [Dictyostelium discoideum AX4]EAL61400.1 hypothetical protein DDB_G0292088 [Dictyostelium discoideum AX4]|eukprot:XP_629821.1 hypothetical protein DDB_G0292088 [Dictyostelium discoideum AX4]
MATCNTTNTNSANHNSVGQTSNTPTTFNLNKPTANTTTASTQLPDDPIYRVFQNINSIFKISNRIKYLGFPDGNWGHTSKVTIQIKRCTRKIFRSQFHQNRFKFKIDSNQR